MVNVFYFKISPNFVCILHKMFDFSFVFLCLRCKDSVITIVPGTDLFESDYFHKNHNMYAMRAQLFFQRFLYGILLHYVSQDGPN